MTKSEIGAKTIISDWLKLSSNDVLTIISDENYIAQAELLCSFASKSTSNVKVLLLSVADQQNGSVLMQEPYSSEIDRSTVIIGASTYSLITSHKIKQAMASGIRFLSLPLSTNDRRDMLSLDFIRMPLDEAKHMADILVKKISGAKNIRVTTPAGTDLSLEIDGRIPGFFTGDFSNGTFCESSCFEVYISPVEDKTNGIMMLDGSFGYIGAPSEPLRIEFKDGKICSVSETEDGRKLTAYIDSFHDDRMKTGAEFGIGINKLAHCSGNCYIEDESSYGTFHIGMGRNITLGGKSDASGHFDLVCFKPTIYFDGKPAIIDGLIIE